MLKQGPVPHGSWEKKRYLATRLVIAGFAGGYSTKWVASFESVLVEHIFSKEGTPKRYKDNPTGHQGFVFGCSCSLATPFEGKGIMSAKREPASRRSRGRFICRGSLVGNLVYIYIYMYNIHIYIYTSNMYVQNGSCIYT